MSTQQCIATLEGHTEAVRALAVLPDGRVVSGSSHVVLANARETVSNRNEHNTLKLWDMSTQQCIATLEGHTDFVQALAVLPDGRVVSGSADNTLKLWDMSTQQCIATLQGHTSSVQALAVLPDGRVVSGSEDKTLKLWRASYAPLSVLLSTHAARLMHNFKQLANSVYLQEQHIPRLLNPRLTSLSLAHSGVNDRLLQIILNHCQQLQTLDISYCRWLTDASIAILMQHSSLIQVTMADTAAISATYKQQLQTHLQQKSASSATEAPVVHYLNTLITVPAQTVLDEAVAVEPAVTFAFKGPSSE